MTSISVIVVPWRYAGISLKEQAVVFPQSNNIAMDWKEKVEKSRFLRSVQGCCAQKDDLWQERIDQTVLDRKEEQNAERAKEVKNKEMRIEDIRFATHKQLGLLHINS